MFTAWFIYTLPFAFCSSDICSIKTYSLVYNRDVKLVCSVHNSCDDCELSWYRGDFPQKLLSIGTASSKDTKYTATKGGTVLIIHNFDTEDINIPYTCYHGFAFYRKNLTMTDNDEYRPSNVTLYSSYSVFNNTKLMVNVSFTKVHPVPNCTAVVNGVDISYRISTTTEQNGILYRVSIRLQHVIGSQHCNGTFHMYCYVGTHYINVFEEKLNKSCSEKRNDSKNNENVLSFFIPSVVIFMIGILLFALCRVFLRNRSCISIDIKLDNIMHWEEAESLI